MSTIAIRSILNEGEIYLNKNDVIALIHYEIVTAPGDEKEEALLELWTKLERP